MWTGRAKLFHFPLPSTRIHSSTFARQFGNGTNLNVPEHIRKHLLPLPPNHSSWWYKLRCCFQDPMKKVYPFILLAYSRGECANHLSYFGIEDRGGAGKLLFMILHVWVIHRALDRQALDSKKLLLWEHLWAYMKTMLCYQQEVEEHNFRHNIEEMQHKTLGFCLSLDEAMELRHSHGDLGPLKRILNIYFNKGRMEEGQVEALSRYVIALEEFVMGLPRAELEHAAFTWPCLIPQD